MCMYCAAGTAVEGCKEERCTLGGFEGLRFAKVGFGGVVEDEDVGWFHEFFLDARRREEDVIIFSDRGTSTCAGDLVGLEVCRWIGRVMFSPSLGCRTCGRAHRLG